MGIPFLPLVRTFPVRLLSHLTNGRSTSRASRKSALHLLVAALEAAVLVLDDHRAVVAGAVEAGEEAGPVDLAEARHARHLPADAGGEDAALVEAVAVDHQVLGVDVQHVRAELADEAGLVDHLPDEVRRVEVHADVAAPGLEDAAPDLRRIGDVVPARPFVVR